MSNSNPDLINPEVSPSGAQVPPLTKFQGQTPALPVVKATEVKYYTCTVPSASMFRPDGKKLPFVHGVFAADLLYDQQYLDKEIAEGHSYIRAATPDEIDALKMRLNPHGTIKEKVRAEVEAELRDKLLAELRAEIALEGKQGNTGSSDASKLAGVDSNPADQKNVVDTGTATVVLQQPAAPLGGIVSTAGIASAAKNSGK